MSISTPTDAKPNLLTQGLFSRRDSIPPRSNVLWRISRGAVRTLTWSVDGTAICLGYWGPGDVVGHALARVKPYQLECITSVEGQLIYDK